MNPTRPRRPATRAVFEVAVICALPIEADAVDALFDHHWDDEGPPYDKAAGGLNAYSAGAIGRHNVVLAHMPGMGKSNAAAVAANCRTSFPNIKLAVVVGIYGVVPFAPNGDETILGDVIIIDGVVQYDFGRRLPGRFARRDTLLDALGRPNAEVRALLAKLKGLRGRKMLRDSMSEYMEVLRVEPELAAYYPGIAQDRLFEATYRHVGDGMLCEECGCSGKLVPRRRLGQGSPQPVVHFGLIASGDTVMKSGEDRDNIAQQEGIIAFEMEGAGVWDSFPCVVIKGACDYADSHKTKAWQRYAAATAAACAKAFLGHWVPSLQPGVRCLLEAFKETYQDVKLIKLGLGHVQERPAGPWFFVPYPRNSSFVGRTATLRKLQQLSIQSTSQERIALCGLGGIGKTQIALEYAYCLQETNPEISVFWVHASTAERFRQAYASIAQECQVPGYDDPKTDVLPLMKKWLERKDCGRWLMVIDNADDVQVFFAQQKRPTDGSSSGREGNLGYYIPECSHGAILITTRNRQTGSKLTKGKCLIDVGEMDEEETAELLRTRLDGINTTSGESSALSSRLEHLPLALVQASAFMQENCLTIDNYLQLLDKSDQHFVDLLSEEFETEGRDSETPHAVAETWILSFEQIQRQNAFAGELLSLMGLFDRQAIPLDFLSHYSEQLGEDKIGDIELTKALGVLKSFCFITEGKGCGFDMHRLVQLVTKRWLSKKGTIRRFARQALLVVSDVYRYGNYENRAICSAYLPHANAVLKLDITKTDEEMVARTSLLDCVGGLFYCQGQWKDAGDVWAQAVDIRRAVLGEEHPATLRGMNNLAMAYRNQGRWKVAEELGIKVLEMKKRVLGEEHPSTLISMAILAATYSTQGRWKEAEALEVQVMETTKEMFGEEHPETLDTMASLVTTYWHQERWKEVEKLGLQVLDMRKRVLGEEHPNTLTSIANLAVTYARQGRLKETEELEVQVIEARKKLLGEEHPGTLISIGNLAWTYWQQERWEEAENLMLQVSEAKKRVLGEEHPETLVSMGNLASMYSDQGRWNEAEKLGLQVLNIRMRLLGEGHPHTLISLADLAKTHQKLGRLKEAEELGVKVLEARKRILGEEHPHTLSSMRSLATAYPEQGRWKESGDLRMQVLATEKRVLGEEHPDTLISMAELAHTWKSQGRLEDALDLMQTCYRRRQQVLGQDHPDTASTLSFLTEWQEQQDNMRRGGDNKDRR